MKNLTKILSALLTFSVSALAGPYDDWNNFKVLSLNTTAAGANVSGSVGNYPVLVRLTNANAGTGSDILSGALASGADLRFTDESGETELSYQIERWTASAAEVWVKLPNVAGNSVTRIRAYWGKPGSVSASNGAAVFDTANGFRAVYHMNEATNANLTDATGLGHTAVVGATNPSDATTGLGVGKTLARVANTGYLIAKSSRLSFPVTAGKGFTMSAWVSPTTCNFSGTNNRQSVISQMASNGAGRYSIMTNTGTTGGWQYRFNTDLAANTATNSQLSSVNTCAANTWQYVSYSYSGSDNVAGMNAALVGYFNGDSTGTESAGQTPLNADTTIGIGRVADVSSNFRFGGSLDEIRITAGARPPEWHKLDYETQKPGASALTQGATQDQSSAPANLSYAAPVVVYGAGAPIAANVLTNTGGVGRISVSPDLPAGLSIDPLSGTLSGTPTQLSPATDYEIVSTNFHGADTAILNIAVVLVAPTELTYSAPAPSYVVGSAIAPNTPTTNGLIDGYAISPALPAGLSFDTSTGVISGNPSDTGSVQDYVVTASNSQGGITDTVSIRVLSAGLTQLAYVTPAIRYVGVAVSDSAVITAAAGPVVVDSFSVAPALPDGLTLDAQTGLISGTPTGASAAANYTVTAHNGRANAVRVVNITVRAAPTALSYSKPAVSYQGGLAAPIAPNLPSLTGVPEKYSITPSLPAGLSIDSATGAIWGTPTAASPAADYQVTAENPAGFTTATVNIAVTTAENYAAWSAAKTLNINTTAAGAGVASGHEQFPVLVRLNPAHAVIFDGAKADGSDIRFSKPDGAGLAYEIDSWDSVGRSAAIWVLLDTTHASGTTPLRIHFGNPGASSKSDGERVFTSANGYVGVWHMGNPVGGNGQSGARPNSMNPGTNDATPFGLPVGYAVRTGMIGAADTLRGQGLSQPISGTAQDHFTLGTFPQGTFKAGGRAAISMWVKPNVNTTNNFVQFVHIGNSIANSGNNGLWMGKFGGTNNQVSAEVSTPSATARTNGANNSLASNAWRYLTFTANGSNDSIYSQGLLSGSISNGNLIRDTIRTSATYIGRAGWNDSLMRGVVDEVRLLNTSRSADWIKLEYKTQKAGANPVFDLAYSAASYVFPEETPVTPIEAPTLAGTASRFSVSPALPAGLIFNASTGAITGTPADASPLQTYTVTAYGDSAWTSTTTFDLRVTSVAPSTLTYSGGTTRVYQAGIQAPMEPSFSGTITSWSIDPALPNGLSINPSTGVIEGFPLVSSPAAVYTVTGTGPDGFATVELTLSVLAHPEDLATWSNSRDIVINTSATGANVAGTVTNFPLLVRLGAGESPIFAQALEGGADVRFTRSNGVTRLPYEIVSWDATGKNAEIWVKVDSVRGNNASQSIKMFWGKAGVNDSSRSSAVFDTASGFTGVWHLNEDGGGIDNVKDATLNALHFTGHDSVAAVPGMVGLARWYNKGALGAYYVDSIANVSAMRGMGASTHLTMSAWVNRQADHGNTEGIFGAYRTGAGQKMYGLSINASNQLRVLSSIDGNADSRNVPTTAAFGAVGSWMHVMATIDQSAQDGTVAKIYVNGVQQPTTGTNTAGAAAAVFASADANARPLIGAQTTASSQQFQGYIDEIQFIKGASPMAVRNADWAKLSYETQKSFQTTTDIGVQAPTLAYAGDSATFTQNAAISALTPSVVGTGVTVTVDPALPAGLSLDASTGAITGTPSATQPLTKHVVTATNLGGTATDSLWIRVNPAAPQALSYLANPAVYITGVAIDTNKATVTGVVDSFTVAPSLPAGLSLDLATGALSGTPTIVTASAEYVVTAHNVTGTAIDTLQITVNPPAPTNLSYDQAAAVYITGVAIDTNKATVTGMVDSFTVAPSLPAGLSLDLATGALSGTPTVVTASAEYVVTAHNVTGVALDTLTLTVNPPAPTDLVYVRNVLALVQGTPMLPDSMTVTGVVDSFTVTPALPAGLTLDKVTGIVSGTPADTSSARDFVFAAHNVTGSALDTVQITVAPAAPADLAYLVNPAVYVFGTPIVPNTATVTGVADSFTVVPALPAGLALNASTGTISGTPGEVSAQADYVVTAHNITGTTTDTLTLTVNVAAPSGLAYLAPSSIYVVDAPITANTATVTGVVDSFTVAPALPAGLALNASTGTISGTPGEVSAQAEYVVTAHNVSGVARDTVSITVNPAAPTALSYLVNPATYVAGVAIDTNKATVTGTVASWSISPAIGNGLSFNAGTGAITGTPTVQAAPVEYVVTASNVTGEAKDTLTITVNHAPPSISYNTPNTYLVGLAITALNPISVGGPVTGYSVSPDLAANTGLSFNTTSGQISGTPNAAHAPTNYSVIATGPGGLDTAVVNIGTSNEVPPSIAYPATLTLTRGIEMTLLLPDTTASGPIDSFTVAPALPAGLSLAKLTGAITGTPSAMSAAASYLFTAHGLGGTDTSSIEIRVLDAAPAISYASPKTYGVGIAIDTLSPSSTGGVVTAWSIAPSLATNTGLAFSTTTGKITGTPAMVSPATNYTITATNDGGSDSAVVSIQVQGAPAITSQPQDTTLVGGSAFFSVSATASGTLSYQWKKNGVNVATGGTSASYSVSGVGIADTGAYSVEVRSTLNGSVTSTLSSAGILRVNVAPTFTSVLRDTTVASGTSASFTSTVGNATLGASSGTLSYQWRKNGVNVATGGTSASYTIASAAVADTGTYSVAVTRTLGSTTTETTFTAGALRVNAAPAIASQPRDTTFLAGASGNAFTVSASVQGGGTLSYQWKRGATNVGTSSATLALANVSLADTGSYTVVVTSTLNGVATSSTSTAGILRVNTTPTFTSVLRDTTVASGTSASFTSTVGNATLGSSSGTLSYQWRKNGVNVATGGTSASYTVASAAVADTGTYSVVVTRSLGTPATTQTATFTAGALRVNAAPAIASQPRDTTFLAGASGNAFSVSASVQGGGTLSYQWKRGATNVGTSSATLALANVSLADTGSYTVVVTSTLNGVATSSTSTAGILRVNTTPTFTSVLRDTTVASGTSASFTSTVGNATLGSSSGTLSYQWRKNGVNVATGGTSASYTIASAAVADTGTYSVVVTRSLGTPATTQTATFTAGALRVNAAPAIASQPRDTTFLAGASGNAFTVSASVQGGGTLSYQWKRGATNVGTSSATLALANVSLADTGSYTVVVTSTLNGVATSSTSTAGILRVNTTPTFTSVLRDTTVASGTSASFTSTVGNAALGSSSGTLSYQWRKNGVNVATGGTSASYTIASAAVADTGTYSVVVTRSLGTPATTQTATFTAGTLRVNAAPVIAALRDTALVAGANVAFTASATAPTGATLGYQWKRNGVDLPGITTQTITRTGLALADTGLYSVTVTSTLNGVAVSATSNAARLTVNTAPVIATQPVEAQTIAVGQNATFTVGLASTALGTSAGTLTYQWKKDGVDLVNGGTVSGATTATLTLTGVAVTDTALYTVVITRTLSGTVSSTTSSGGRLLVPTSIQPNAFMMRVSGQDRPYAFQLPEGNATERLTLSILDAWGRTVWSKTVNPAKDKVTLLEWNGRASNGRLASAGVYVVRIHVVNAGKTQTFVRKAVTLKPR